MQTDGRTETIIEAEGQLDAVSRELSVERTRGGADSDAAPGADDGELAVTLRLIQGHPVGVEELWQALTSPERLAQWLHPVAGELREGGRFEVEGAASGVVESCRPPRSPEERGMLQVTWEFGEDVSRVVARCDPVEEAGATAGARLILEHHDRCPESFWREYGPGAAGVGWDLTLLGLAHHLRAGRSRPVEESAWVTTPEAREFIAGTSIRWAAASVAAGTEEEQARAAEARATAFYTEPQPGE
ncbi:SRPBCC domain-containing protein [Nesterenkonia sp. F]|uniref:SRPBCC domain-containing protein n=1 Tax=Nesterenkonia sp. F TaxID=795955 RepID=UPI000255C946|nr:SRPBCC domain-containing protein [Nesterenkonia sp. F]